MRQRHALLVVILLTLLWSGGVGLTSAHAQDDPWGGQCPYPPTILYAVEVCDFFGFFCDYYGVETSAGSDPCSGVSFLNRCSATYLATCDVCYGCH